METQQSKLTVKSLINLKKKNIISVNPEYQRGAVWSENQKKKLIDSILRGYVLPLFYFHNIKIDEDEIQNTQLDVIDGQQRINAIYEFKEGIFKLFDPIKDDKVAKFPKFIKDSPCEWANCDYITLPEDLKNKFNETELYIVKVNTENEDEVRDLFIRLQAGLPLNAQEKRDAWAGGYGEFVLRFGGKNLSKYQGHEFFSKLVGQPSVDRGSIRTLCAQIGMLYFENAAEGNWLDIGTQPIDDYYYRYLSFNINSPNVTRFAKILDLLVELLYNKIGPKLKVHEVIHLVLLVDSLMDEYTNSWRTSFSDAFIKFRENSLIQKKNKSGDYYFSYIFLTQAQATNAQSIAIRHKFFVGKMFEFLKPVLKDKTRTFGQIERELIFYRDKMNCVVCKKEIKWEDLDIHHLKEHQHGGETSLENGVSVHKSCHPLGAKALEFYDKYMLEKQNSIPEPMDEYVKEIIDQSKSSKQKFIDMIGDWEF